MPRPSRVVIYFASLVGLIALINTPIPQVIVSAVLNREAGEAVARSLGTATKDLVLVLLISLYFEYARSREHVESVRSIDAKVNELTEIVRTARPEVVRELVLRSTEPENLMVAALDQRLHAGDDKKLLATQLLLQREVFREFSISMTLERLEGATMVMRTDMTFLAPEFSPLIAVADNPAHTAALTAACPELFESVTLPASTPFAAAVKSFGDDLEVYVESRAGHYRRVPFRRLPLNVKNPPIPPPVGIPLDRIALFGPARDLSTYDAHRFHCRYQWRMAVSEHFVYWSAARLMFVRNVTLDVRKLTDLGVDHIWEQTFLSDLKSLALDVREGCLSLSLDRWVVEGQGVMLVWKAP